MATGMDVPVVVSWATTAAAAVIVPAMERSKSPERSGRVKASANSKMIA